MRRVLASVAALLGCWGGAEAIATTKQSLTVNEEPKYEVAWWTEDDHVFFEITLAGNGWWGIGLSRAGSMSGADIVVGRASQGPSKLIDCHGEGNFPVKDTKQDYETVSATFINGVQNVVIKRAAKSCDPHDIDATQEGTFKLLWALPSEGSTSDFPGPHSSGLRGHASMTMKFYEKIAEPDPDTVTVHQVLTNKAPVPAYPGGGSGHGPGTMYWCSTHFLNITDKQHIIEIAPYVEKGNEARVHHILLYECPQIENHQVQEYNGICYTGSNMPDYVRTCNGGVVVAGWAVGGSNVIYPKDAGYAVGGDSSKYFLMETHYDSRPGMPPVVDSSGFSLKVSSELRKYDVGITQTGASVTPLMEIPPGRSHFSHTGWCTSECTEEMLAEPIYIFGALLHGHLSARRIEARIFRNNTEVSPLSVDNFYDFNFQQVVPIVPSRELLPGDVLSTTCTFETLDRKDITRGGLATDSEMCLTYVYYYPKQPSFKKCLSTLDSQGVVSSQCTKGGKSSAVIPSNFTGWQQPLCEGNPVCGDGKVDLDFGEQCDDGNNKNGDGCDAYCFAENDLICFYQDEELMANYTCVKRPVVDGLQHYTAKCNKTMIDDLVGEIIGIGVGEFLNGNPALKGCPKGPRSCDTEHEDHDPKCREYLTDLANTYFCCAMAKDALGQIGGFLVPRLPDYCGETAIETDSMCGFCGDGSISANEMCDQGNFESGDGCSNECKVESGYSCKSKDGLSFCQAKSITIDAAATPGVAVTTYLSVVAVLATLWQ